ncbi:MAG: hypothetical protein V3T21_02505 [Candidatus Margulisiibacteriota bacterium]
MRARKLFPFVLLALVLASSSFAEIENINNLRKRFSVISRIKSSGKERWHSKVKAEIIHHKDITFAYFEEEGEEPRGKIKRYKTWKSSAYSCLEDSKIFPYLIKMVIKNDQGEIIEDLKKIYDRENKRVICTVNGKVKEFEFKESLVDKQNIVVWLMTYPFEEKKDINFHLLTHAPAMHKMNMKYKGKEKLTIGSREVDCYKLEMLPDLGLLNFIRVFFPKTYFWYEVKAPHNFVRYEGLESGLGTPYVVIEIIPQEG